METRLDALQLQTAIRAALLEYFADLDISDITGEDLAEDVTWEVMGVIDDMLEGELDEATDE